MVNLMKNTFILMIPEPMLLMASICWKWLKVKSDELLRFLSIINISDFS